MKMKLAALLACLTCSFPLAASEAHDHDETYADFDVEAYQYTLKGSQPFGEACYLGVVSQGKTADGSYYAVVETNFQHEGEGPGRLRVVLDKGSPQLLTATSASGSRISVELSSSSATITDALRYAVRWQHEGHFDSGICDNLSLIHDASKE